MSGETGNIIMSLEEFRRRALPSEGAKAGTVTECDITLFQGNIARIDSIEFTITTKNNEVHFAVKK